MTVPLIKVKPFLRLFITCFFMLVFRQAFSQQTAIDSLLRLFPQTENRKDRCVLLTELSSAYRIVDPKKGIYFGVLAQKNAQDLDWKKGMGEAMFVLASNYQLTAEYPKSLDLFFGALKIAESLEDDKLMAKSLSEIAIVYRKTEEYEKTLLYAERSLKILKDQFGKRICNRAGSKL